MQTTVTTLLTQAMLLMQTETAQAMLLRTPAAARILPKTPQRILPKTVEIPMTAETLPTSLTTTRSSLPEEA